MAFEESREKLGILGELWAFMQVRKKWWLGPIVMMLALLGLLVVFTQGSAVAPVHLHAVLTRPDVPAVGRSGTCGRLWRGLSMSSSGPRLGSAPLRALLFSWRRRAVSRPDAGLPAAPLEKLTIERINSEPSLSGALPSRFAVASRRQAPHLPAPLGRDPSLVALDVTKGRETQLLDGARLKAPGDKPLPLATASWLPDGRTLLVPALGDIFTVDVRTGRACGRSCSRPRPRSTRRRLPTAASSAFVRKNDLYVVVVESAAGHPPHAERLRNAAERHSRLGLRGGARLALRAGLRLVARLARDRLPAARPVARAHLPDRRLPARAQRGRAGSATPRPAPRTRSSGSA